MIYKMGEYDVAVIGAGHAGVEAALASARLGCRTIMFTISLDQIANMPCNPSIGGTAKGYLGREIDALGGEMGKAADKCFIQSRMLNRGKGAAVHSLRVQADRVKYHNYMKNVCEKQENLYIKQGEISEIVVEDGKVTAVRTSLGAEYAVKAAIIATGTYLKGKIHIGEASYESWPLFRPDRALGFLSHSAKTVLNSEDSRQELRAVFTAGALTLTKWRSRTAMTRLCRFHSKLMRTILKMW